MSAFVRRLSGHLNHLFRSPIALMPKDKKDHRITIRLNDEQYAALEQIAEDRSIAASSLAREAIQKMLRDAGLLAKKKRGNEVEGDG